MNIFENAKFGDKFRTRDGRRAIYGFTVDERHILIVEDFSAVFRFDDSGVSNYPNDKIDIVGKWQDPINEEELDKIAIDDIFKVLNQDYLDGKISFNKIKEIYKAGYRKAKGE
jgi:hypothetical protein